MTMTKKNKIAVIGAGYWGKNLIRNFNDLGHLGAICDQDSQLLRKYQKQYPKIDCYQSVSEILQAPEINSVAIATPAITHGKIALRALMNGKHTFVEKPLCLNIGSPDSTFLPNLLAPSATSTANIAFIWK